MFIAAVVVSIVLAVAVTGSAFAKLTRNPQVIESVVNTVGFPADRLWVLAALEIAGAVGLVVGLFWAPLGIAAAVGLVLYFVSALGGHVRVGDTAPASLAPAGGLLVLSVVALVLRSITA